MNILSELFKYKDDKYRDFISKLVPNVEKGKFIGVRAKHLKMIAKDIFKNGYYREFVESLPHRYFEENMIHSYIINMVKNEKEIFLLLDRFIPYIDNWAVNDAIIPKNITSDKDLFFNKVYSYLKGHHPYQQRLGIYLLIKFATDDWYTKDSLDRIIKIKSDQYYVNMAIAWYIATIINNKNKDGIRVLEDRILDKFTHKMAIQKCIDSKFIDASTKEYLKNLK